MKTLYTAYFFLLLFCLGPKLRAQVDVIDMRAGYGDQVFYNLSTGGTQVVANESWDIAFTAIGPTDAGIWINESEGASGSTLELYWVEGMTWGDSIVEEDLGASNQLFNTQVDWAEGAFNSLRDTSDPFDYGWGRYDIRTHELEGDKVFVLRQRDSALLMVEIQGLVDGEYILRTRNMSTGLETPYRVSRSLAEASPVMFLSLRDSSVFSLKEEAHLWFARYRTPLDDGAGNILQYSVTGVLSMPGIGVIQVDGVDVDEVMYSDVVPDASSNISTIGHDWKNFDLGTFAWSVLEDRAYFVQDGESIFKLIFVDFEGAGTGITRVERSEVDLVASLSDPLLSAEQAGLAFFPNPCVSTLEVLSQREDVREIRCFNLAGALVSSYASVGRAGRFDLAHLQCGTYVLVAELVDGGRVVQKIVVQ